MVNAEVVIEDRLTPALDRLRREFGDMRRVFRPMMERVVLASRENINTAGRRSGHPYAARAASTMRSIASANRKGFRSVGLPLHASGRLLRSLSFGGPDSRYEETDSEATFTILVPYARFHQMGTRRMPQRRIHDLTDRDVREMRSVARRSFREKIEPLGFEYSESEGAAF